MNSCILITDTCLEYLYFKIHCFFFSLFYTVYEVFIFAFAYLNFFSLQCVFYIKKLRHILSFSFICSFLDLFFFSICQDRVVNLVVGTLTSFLVVVSICSSYVKAVFCIVPTESFSHITSFDIGLNQDCQMSLFSRAVLIVKYKICCPE